eukprot:gene12331-biopygen4933
MSGSRRGRLSATTGQPRVAPAQLAPNPAAFLAEIRVPRCNLPPPRRVSEVCQDLYPSPGATPYGEAPLGLRSPQAGADMNAAIWPGLGWRWTTGPTWIHLRVCPCCGNPKEHPWTVFFFGEAPFVAWLGVAAVPVDNAFCVHAETLARGVPRHRGWHPVKGRGPGTLLTPGAEGANCNVGRGFPLKKRRGSARVERERRERARAMVKKLPDFCRWRDEGECAIHNWAPSDPVAVVRTFCPQEPLGR